MLRERKWAVMAGRKSTKPATKATEVAEVEAIEPKAEEIKTEEIAEPKTVETKKAPVRKTKSAKAEAPKEKAPQAEEAAELTKEEASGTKGRKTKAVKKETASAKTETAKKPAEKCTLHIQYAGRSYAQEDLVKIAKDVWRYDEKRKVGELESIELYVKPEENKVYYVMNGEVTGNFDI